MLILWSSRSGGTSWAHLKSERSVQAVVWVVWEGCGMEKLAEQAHDWGLAISHTASAVDERRCNPASVLSTAKDDERGGATAVGRVQQEA